MRTQLACTIALASIVLLSSCAKQPAPPPPLPVEITPSLGVKSGHNFDLGSGTKAIIWDVRGEKVRELTARLLIYADGKPGLKSELVCKWNDLSKPLSGQLVFLAQSGDLFGAKGKYLPSLTLSFQSGGPQFRTDFVSAAPLDIKSRGTATHMSSSTPSHYIGTPLVIYDEIFTAPTEGSWSSSNIHSEEDLVPKSRGGRIALAVFIDWKP
jgi:hypothetical protein